MSAERRRRRALCSAVSISTVAAILALVLTFAGGGSAASKVAPTNTTLPSISGTTEDGQQLSATNGSWNNNGSTITAYHYTWQRCDTSGGSCSAVGSDSNHYTLVSADVGSTMRVKVVAHNADGDSSPAKSGKTNVVTAGGTKPNNTSLPTISGTAQDNQILTADHGNWSGTTPISYQWQRDGTNLFDPPAVSGTNSPTLVFSTARVTDAGTYYCIVSNVVGPVTSPAATLTVITVPMTITTQPTNRTVIVGANATFTVSATGSAPISYQWQRDGTNVLADSVVSGAQLPTLSFTGARTNDSGVYYCIVSNIVGPVTSSVATLTVGRPPTILVQPATTLAPLGSSTGLVVQVTGNDPLSYQWQHEGVALTNGGRIGGADGPAGAAVHWVCGHGPAATCSSPWCC
jgi:hypothetical protein